MDEGDYDFASGYNINASFLHPVSDQFTVSGDLALSSYTYEFDEGGNWRQ